MINFLFLLLSVAHADRGSLNGGGLAEMKAIAIHLHLKDWMAPCLHQPAACGVEDTQTFANVYRAIEMSTPEKLSIDPLLAAAYSTQKRPGSMVTIATREIYRADGLPKSSPEIAALLLEAISSQVDFRSPDVLREETRKFTVGFSEETSRYSFSSDPKLEITSLNVRRGEKQLHFLFLEDSVQTLNLGEKLPELGRCEVETPVVQIQNWRRNYEAGATSLAADVTTYCGVRASYQALVVEFRADALGRIFPPSVVLQLRDSL